MPKSKIESPHYRDMTDYSLVTESECDYQHLSPIPTEDDLKSIYTKDYYQTHYPNWIQKSLDEKAYWLSVYEDRYDVFDKFISAPTKSILDIGSFLGFFLEVGQVRGWTTLGIEPSDPAREVATKNEVRSISGFFEDHSVSDIGTFDVINMALTLEHIQDPKAVLERIYQFLNPGGLVCIEVPNDFNALQIAAQKTLGLHQYWVAPPHHINYFNFETLPPLLKKCGFNIVHQMASFPMELFLMMGENYIGNDTVGAACHQKRMTFETNLKKAGLNDFKNKLYEFFARQNMGREMILFGQKP